MKQSTCVAGNQAIRAHIPIAKIFHCGRPCHELDVVFSYGFGGEYGNLIWQAQKLWALIWQETLV